MLNMPTYRRKPSEATAIQYDTEVDLGAFGCEVYNGPNDIQIVRVGAGEIGDPGAFKEVPVGAWVTKSTNPFEPFPFKVYQETEFPMFWDEIV